MADNYVEKEINGFTTTVDQTETVDTQNEKQ